MDDSKKCLLNILLWYHAFCEANDLRYYLVEGTMLGAARHLGFIPWDDDIDVGMPRSDYERFVSLMGNDIHDDRYMLENEHSPREEYLYPHSKLYDTETTLIEKRRVSVVMGVYIDVFPLDGIGNTPDESKRNYKKLGRKQDVLAVRAVTTREGRAWYKNLAVKIIQLLPNSPEGNKRLVKEIVDLCKEHSYDDSEYVGLLMSSYRTREIMPKEYFGTPKLYSFEGHELYGVENADSYLTQLYGDWKTPPSEENRRSDHTNEMIDLNSSFLRRPVRVLMIVSNLRVSNGVTNFVMNYYRNMDHEKIIIDFATLEYRESPYIEEVEGNGSQIFVLPSLVKHPFRHMKECRRIIREGKYDIVHDNSLNKTIPLMKKARKTIPVRILHSHSTRMGETDSRERLNKLFLSSLKRTANHYTACSSNAGKAMFGTAEFAIIPNIIDTDVLRYDDARRMELRTREGVSNKKVVASVGRVAAPKNPFFAIDVISEVLKVRDDVEYWWIGSGPLDEQVSKYVGDKGLSDRIRLFGSREDMNDLYQCMDVFFLPSRFEGFGLVCIEAEACGLPCVVSSEFPPEVDVTGEVTFISLTQDTGYWASKIIEALDRDVDRKKANDMCRASYYSKSGSGNILSDYYGLCTGRGASLR
ncbi:Phosphorylcholine metabolism protein LicD [Ruminococcaceae bacterium YRB3002]|nr:Phosphorylcholine metabolism protein LicD [Ruminococcaceae bacterium YRB3002]